MKIKRQQVTCYTKIENYKMTVEEFVTLHNEARNGLWNFICQHDSMIKELEMKVSENEQLLYTLQEPRVKTEIKPYFMGRIVDVEQFLKQYELNWNNVQQEVILHITDSFAPWNNVSVRLANYEIAIIEEPMDKGIEARYKCTIHNTAWIQTPIRTK